MMKKMLLMFSVLVVLLFVVSCAPGEKTLAGQAVSTSSSYLMKSDYFVLPDAAGQNHLYQYKGADKPTATSPKIRIKNIKSGYTIELEYLYQSYAGGIKGGALFEVDKYLYGGDNQTKSYYLLYGVLPNSEKSDPRLIVSLDPEGKEKLSLKVETLKI